MQALCCRPCCPRPADPDFASHGSAFCSHTCRDALTTCWAALDNAERHDSDLARRFPFQCRGSEFQFLAFAFPDSAKSWDIRCATSFLGNSYPLETELWMPISGRNYCFQTARAAFGALKYAHAPGAIERFAACVSGGSAIQLTEELTGNGFTIDPSYNGRQSGWLAMWEVLQRKFLNSKLQDQLLKTDNYFLLNHAESSSAWDATWGALWSDGHDGKGDNWLGMQLMLLRDHLRKQRGAPASAWEDFLGEAVEMSTGNPKNSAEWRHWQDLVRHAALEVHLFAKALM